jgi:sugar transferase EpsL
MTSFDPKNKAEYRRRIQPGKRAFDLLFGVPTCLLLLPLLALIAILVRVRLGTPIFFLQERPGFQSKPFTLVKFRTMTDTRDVNGSLLPDRDRLTTLGRFLRKLSLDELPEIFNVLRGDLSLVGPRPLLIKYLPYFSEKENLRHTVMPGITGWAQIHGRNYLPWDQRLALDVWYVENWSIRLDLYILAATLWKVLRREGVAPDTDVVEPPLDQERKERYRDA